MWETTKEEMDFFKEADHLELFYNNQKEISYITCPKVYREYSSCRLLVMSYIDGIQIDQTASLEELGYDMLEIGEKAAENFCKQILEDGFFMPILILEIFGFPMERSHGWIWEWQDICQITIKRS